MRTRSKLLLSALIAALTLTAAVATASAGRLSLSEQGFRLVYTPLTFTGLGGLVQVRCNITIRGSFHYRTILKTRSLLGYITDARLTRPCSGGEAWILNGVERPTNTLPWHMTYDSFRGTLPRIEGVRLAIIGFSILLEVFGEGCLYASTSASPAFAIINLNTATGAALSKTMDSNARIPLASVLGEAAVCPSNGSFTGTSSSFTNGAGGVLSVRLI